MAPLGAGDLIDRAIRLYRKHFTTLLKIAAPPIMVAAVGSVFFTIGYSSLTSFKSDTSILLNVFLTLVGLGLRFAGWALNLVLMGGAARNLITHLLWNEPVSASATYRNVRPRFWSLLGAAVVVMLWLGLAFGVWIVSFYFGLAIVALISLVMLAIHYIVTILFAIVLGLTVLLASLALFFFIAGRMAYVLQVMLVEGKTLGTAISRSFSLARGNVLFMFTLFATFSALMILIIPLGWYAWVNGIDFNPAQAASWPVWYSVSYNVLNDLSMILISPIWMLGLSLLYVDERVRHEGYDIELFAAQTLGELPPLPNGAPIGSDFNNLRPQTAATTAAQVGGVNTIPAVALPAPGGTNYPPPHSTLGLN